MFQCNRLDPTSSSNVTSTKRCGNAVPTPLQPCRSVIQQRQSLYFSSQNHFMKSHHSRPNPPRTRLLPSWDVRLISRDPVCRPCHGKQWQALVQWTQNSPPQAAFRSQLKTLKRAVKFFCSHNNLSLTWRKVWIVYLHMQQIVGNLYVRQYNVEHFLDLSRLF